MADYPPIFVGGSEIEAIILPEGMRELIEGVKKDDRSESELLEDMKEQEKLELCYEIVPTHLSNKSKLKKIRGKRGTLNAVIHEEKIMETRTYFKREDYSTLHRRVVSTQQNTMVRMSFQAASYLKSTDNVLSVEDFMLGDEQKRCKYVLRVNITGGGIDLDEDKYEKLHHAIGDTLQDTVFSVTVIPGKVLYVQPVMLENALNDDE